MYTVSDILEDLHRGIMANNLNENRFSYRIICFINSESENKKYYVDASYDGLRAALENMIKKNLTTTNCIVVATVTTLKDGKCISLLSRSYAFSLNEYFRKICESKEKDNINSYYGRRKANWC